jgi:preprotein translocase subunit YajC
VLISNAYAQTGPIAPVFGGIDQLFIVVAMIGIFYFLMIRPQQKKAKEHKAMLEALGKGDEIITQGGIAGRITKVGEDFITISVADNVEIQLQRAAVSTLLPHGTLKGL